MKRRHVTAILLAGVMTVSVLTGCGNQTDTTHVETIVGLQRLDM